MKKYLILALIIIGALGYFSKKDIFNSKLSDQNSTQVGEAKYEIGESGSEEIAGADIVESSVESKPQERMPSEANGNFSNKLKLVEQIIASRNDNDPRLDSEFNNLSENDRKELQSYYKSLAPENFNGKGTLVFLLGRNLSTVADMQFLNSVLAEPPCLSVANCALSSSSEPSEMDHADDVSKSYPQLVALNRIETWLRSDVAKKAAQDMRQGSLDALKVAARSPAVVVSSKAETLLELFKSIFGNG